MADVGQQSQFTTRHVPAEIVAQVLENNQKSKRMLRTYLSVNKTFYAEACRLLYKSVNVMNRGVDLFFRSVSDDARLGSYVKELEFGFTGDHTTSKILTIYSLITRGLHNLVNLESIVLTDGADHWVHQVHSQKLHTLILRCDWTIDLENWIAQRNEIRTLRLGASNYPEPFPISILPNLEEIALGQYVPVFAQILIGRPIRRLALSMPFMAFMGDPREYLRNVALACTRAQANITMLTLLFFSLRDQGLLLSDVLIALQLFRGVCALVLRCLPLAAIPGTEYMEGVKRGLLLNLDTFRKDYPALEYIEVVNGFRIVVRTHNK